MDNRAAVKYNLSFEGRLAVQSYAFHQVTIEVKHERGSVPTQSEVAPLLTSGGVECRGDIPCPPAVDTTHPYSHSKPVLNCVILTKNGDSNTSGPPFSL